MFFPDGFIPLRDVYTECRLIAFDRFPPELFEREVDIDPRSKVYAEILFFRFGEKYSEELWAFMAPNTLLRASHRILWRPTVYDGPCPEDIEEARSALNHLAESERFFLTAGMCVQGELHQKAVDEWGLDDDLQSIRVMAGATICWKPGEWPMDLRKALRPLEDETYLRGIKFHSGKTSSENQVGSLAAYEAFLKVCPNGKEASGYTWPEIEEKTGWSRRSIMRAQSRIHGQQGGQRLGKRE